MSSKLFKQFIQKAVLSKQGPPGPAPRQGLQWKPQTHRWIRPQEQVSPIDSTTPYDPGKADKLKSKMQKVMNDRVGKYLEPGWPRRGIRESDDLSTKIHNEVLLGDTEDFGGISVLEAVGVGVNADASDADEEHMDDLMDELVTNAMEHHGVTDEDWEEEDEDAYDNLEDDDDDFDDEEKKINRDIDMYLKRRYEDDPPGTL